MSGTHDDMRRDGMGTGGGMRDRGPGDLIRAGGLAVALTAYGLFGAPTPPGVGWTEMAVAAGLACTLGVVRPLCVGTGLMLIAPSARLHEVVGTAAFLYLLWVPLLGAVFAGAAPEDVVRDIVPLGFLFLPVLLAPAGPLTGRFLPIGLAGVGLLFAIRWWWPAVDIASVGRTVMAEGDLYLLNSPAVLFTAVWLPLEGAARLFRRPRPGSAVLAIAVSALLVAAGAVAAAALAGAVHRAAVLIAAATVACRILVLGRRTPLVLATVALAAGGVAAMLQDTILGTAAQIAWKTETYGLNERASEAVAVADHIGSSPASLVFGAGWGALVRNPAVGEMWVSYTHSFATYMLLKTGIAGAVAVLAYLLSLLPPLVALMKREPTLAFGLLPSLALGLFAHTSFKYLCFGLILSIVTARTGQYRDTGT
ncbi:hypothetical protein JL100_009465 [Skermanella mucosa]|uniref:hypothetical protein n=1 Tax=Skermanella mucosa TaxID=1789672 RepID=UPI00192B2F90|nr:hypothetical protein [Skermanella mucosa]UEM22947.1 hypothetical protein JL100_009465 [Skermanella mucosa]